MHLFCGAGCAHMHGHGVRAPAPACQCNDGAPVVVPVPPQVLRLELLEVNRMRVILVRLLSHLRLNRGNLFSDRGFNLVFHYLAWYGVVMVVVMVQ